MIKIICVGKLKEKYLIDAVEEYQKRISKYTNLQMIELKDSDINKEKEEIIKYILPKDYIITLQIEGNMIDSPTLAKKIDETLIRYSNIAFIIGGSNGLHELIKNKADYALSFSKLTFPHQLFRIMLLEQIYRSYKIINNETYHK